MFDGVWTRTDTLAKPEGWAEPVVEIIFYKMDSASAELITVEAAKQLRNRLNATLSWLERHPRQETV